MSNIPSSFNKYLAYSASAGSGKTFALAVRYISLLFMGESPNTILTATFTKKAAAEMRERVIDSLRGLNRAENIPFLDAISKETGITQKEILRQQPLVLSRFLESKNFIVTLDSFFSSILRSSSFEIGLEPEFETKESGNEGLDKIFLDELRHNKKLGSLVELSININDKRFSNIFNLMQRLYKLDPILPNKSIVIEDIGVIERDIQRVRLELLDLVIFSGASQRAINNFKESSIKELFQKGVFKNKSLLDTNDYKKYTIKYPNIDILYLELKSLLNSWADAKEGIILYNLLELYNYYKNSNIINAKGSSLLSFDDLTYFTYRLLSETVDKDFIYFKIDSKFKHILLDEFQDTSTIQFLMLKPLIDEIFAGDGQGEFRSFFYVGDTKQSLYRFRGGVEDLFDMVAQKYNITVMQMDRNYRSSKSIVNFVNEQFKNIDRYTPQKSRDSANNGFVEVVEVKNSDDTAQDILQKAVDRAKELISNGISTDNITFLVFINRDGERLQNLCYANNIDTILKTSSSLKNIAKVASIIAIIKYLFNKENIQYSAYKSAFLENIDIDESEIDFSWFNPYMKPFDIIDKLIDSFGYFEQDPNLLKLLDFSSKYGDVPTFIEEFESSSIAVASNTLHGASIMTIHSSKGLEFKNVILLDKLTRPDSDKEPILLEFNDNLYVEDIFYRISKRDNFNDNYKKILADRRILAKKDTLNILYVAITRAIDNLIIIKKESSSVFDVLSMKSIKVGNLDVKNHENNITFKEDKKPIAITSYGKQNSAKKEKDDSYEVDYDAISFGLALHYALEMMGDFNKKYITQAVESSKNHYGLILEDNLWEDIERRVTNLVDNIEFQNLLKDATIYQERAISYNGKVKRVDLLLEYKNSFIVIDYKSSKKFEEKHKEQVKNYVSAIENITNKDIKGIVLYVLKDKIDIVYI